MSCRRAYELDLPAFLADPRDATWDDFRAHYPRCPECSAEVAAWTALHASLAHRHPEPAELLRWSDDPDSLAADTRTLLARHLEQCPSCRDELRALDRFNVAVPAPGADPAGSDAPAVAPPAHAAATMRHGGRHAEARARNRPASAPGPGRAPERRPGGALRRVLWHPAFAYAVLALVLLLPTFRDAYEREAGRDAFDAAATRTAEELPASAPVPVPAGADERRKEEQVSPPGSLADSELDARVDRTAPRLLRQAPPRPAAPAPAAPAPAPPAPAARAAGSADAARAQPAQPPEGAAGGASLRALGSALERDATVRLLPRGAGATRTLVVVLPSGISGAAVIDVRIRDEDGERELRQRAHRTSATAGEVNLEIPAGFSAPQLVVEVYADGVGPVARGVVVP